MAIDHGQNDLHRLGGIAGGFTDSGQPFISVDLHNHVGQHQIAFGIPVPGPVI